MKLTYTVEFDLTLHDEDAFPGDKLAANITTELEKAAHDSFVAAISAIDDQELSAGKQASIACLAQWNSKAVQSS